MRFPFTTDTLMRRARIAAPLLALLTSALLAGCGMRGPLYLPERPAPERQGPAGSQAPRSSAPAATPRSMHSLVPAPDPSSPTFDESPALAAFHDRLS